MIHYKLCKSVSAFRFYNFIPTVSIWNHNSLKFEYTLNKKICQKYVKLTREHSELIFVLGTQKITGKILYHKIFRMRILALLFGSRLGPEMENYWSWVSCPKTYLNIEYFE